MFKSKARKVAIASLLSVATLVSIPFNALAAGVIATSPAQLQAAIYSDMVARDTAFTVNYTGAATNATIGTVVTTATSAAEKSDDYLNWSWTSFGASLGGAQGNYTINVTAGYLTTAAQEAVVSTDVTQTLASIITPGMNDFQKEQAIHSWIISHVSYDYSLANHSAYSALVAPNKTVCQGYALLMYKMLMQAGVTTRIVSGTLDGGSHAWNMVQIGGLWYQVDATNDEVNNNKYYNVTDTVLTQNGFVWDKTAFPACTSTYVNGELPGGATATTVTLSKTTDSLTVGATDTLTPTVTPTNTVTWTSSNPAVVSVANGVVKGVASGTATITATTPDNVTATCTVTVATPTTITLSKTTDSLNIGATDTLTPTVTPTSNVTWVSSNPAVVSVVNGVIKGVTQGTATVTATTTNNVTATCAVTVATPTVVTLSKATDTLSLGATDTLTSTVTPTGTVTWVSSNPAIVSVDNGVIKGVAIGTATITAQTANNASAICAVTVTAPVATVKLSKTTDSLMLGTTDTLTATATPSSPVVWTSSNPTVVSAANGIVKASAIGVAIITARTTSGATATCVVVVTPPKSAVKLNSNAISVNAGTTASLSATESYVSSTLAFPSQNVVWTSSNQTVATVSNGAIKVLTPGTTVITATLQDGTASDSCVVTAKAAVVLAAATLKSAITLNNTALSLAVGTTGNLMAKESYVGSTLAFPWENVIWASSDNGVVTVVNGSLQAVKAGTAIISITLADGSATASCLVTVK